MAAKIDILRADKALTTRFGINGNRKLRAEFDPGDITNAFIECYQDAIKTFHAN